MSTVVAKPTITPLDRFGLTLCLAIILHAVIILGLNFTPEDMLQARYETMEIILVHQSDPTPVDDAQFVAQANLEGGGDSEEKLNPGSPSPAPFPEQAIEETAAPTTEQSPAQEEVDVVESETKEEEEEPIALEEELLVAETEQAKEVLPEVVKETEKTEEVVKSPTKDDAKPVETISRKMPKPIPIPERKTPSAVALLTNSFKIASLSAEIRRKTEAKAKRPKRKFISASTRESKYAAYMEAWRSKVERVGNLNYPDVALRNKLSGSLILDVALDPDGSINEITVRRPSGHKVLDDAAIRIVELAAPYAPFPDKFRKEVDILHITRTWQFINNKGFR